MSNYRRFWSFDPKDSFEWRTYSDILLQQIISEQNRYLRVNSCPPKIIRKRKESKKIRSLSENNLLQQKTRTHFTSCPSLAFEWPDNLEQNNDILSMFRSKQFAILSGSASGLSSIGLQNLVKRYTNISLDDNNDKQTAWNIIEPHFFQGPPRIRLETVFDILQQYIDPNLSLLDVLTTDTPAIDQSHEILSMLALTSTIVTTNFDHLIEDAGRFHLSTNEQIVPFDVFCTEEHFQKVHNSILSNKRSTDFVGLWKIHGTVAIWKNNEKVLMRADEDGGPIVTLKRLSLTRESNERRMFLHYLLETRPFLILNYSGTDDFDVTRWLKTVEQPKNVLWIQHVNDISEPVFWNGTEIAQSSPNVIACFDRALIAMANAWHERGIADRLTVVTTNNSIEFLLKLIPLNLPEKNNEINRMESYEEYTLSPPTPWQNYIVSGAMLSHLSYFSLAKKYFDYAATKSRRGLREYSVAKIAAAEASIEIGDRTGRIQAMNEAIDAAKTAPLSLRSWANRKSKYITAMVKRFVECDGQAIAITELQQLLDQCGKPEDSISSRDKNVAHDAAILLAQLRRFVPSSPEPSDIARQWIESIPKQGLLHTKALNLHETALNKYQLAKTIENIDFAMRLMKEAIEIREELGHMRGLVASLNVLGSMQMRRADWCQPFPHIYIQHSAEQFRRSIDYSDKHASIFDQFQARIHLAICLLRYSEIFENNIELSELIDYFQTKSSDDLRTQIESEFCLTMNIFTDLTLTNDEIFDKASQSFENLANKYTSYNDARLIRILAAARFNSELCHGWKNGHVHKSNSELTKDIITRKISNDNNAYWSMRILRAENYLPNNRHEQLQLLLDPLSP